MLSLLTLTIVLAHGAESAWEFWSPDNGAILDELLESAKADPHTFAAFDADNTIWQHDLEESLLPYMENLGVITRDTMDPSLVLIPFKEDESVFAYYYRLCEIDDKVCYPWIAQIFAGHTLRTLKKYVDVLYALTEPIPVRYWVDGKLTDSMVDPPKIFNAQRELINKLQDNDVPVFVISAAAEELVRMVASDPKYGLNVPPERVIGVSMLLKDTKTEEVTTARRQIKLGHFYDDVYPEEAHLDRLLTPYLWSPETFYVGKVAAMMDYIDPIKKPILVAGDSRNDHFMLLYSGGYRIWVDRKASYTAETMEKIDERLNRQLELNQWPTADRNWIIAKPEELHGASEPALKVKRRR